MASFLHERALLAFPYFFYDHVGAIVICSVFLNVVPNALFVFCECVLMRKSVVPVLIESVREHFADHWGLTGGGHKQSLLLFKLIKLLLGLFKLHLLFSKSISLWGRRQHILYWALGDLILEFVVGYHAQHPLAHTSSSRRLLCHIVDIETFTLEDGVEFLDRFVLNLIFLEFTQSLREVRVIHFFLSIVPASLYAQQDLDCVHTLYDILRRRFETLHLVNGTLG